MTWQSTPYVALLFFGGSVALVLAAYSMGRIREERPTASLVSFLTLALATTLWSIGYGLQLASVDLAAKLFWTRIAWLGVGATAVAWPTFVLVYTGRRPWLSPVVLSLIGAIPALTVIAFWLPPFDELVVGSATTVRPGPITVLDLTPGPLLLLFVVYSYLLDVLALALLAIEAIESVGRERRLAGVLLFVGSVPLLGSWFSVAGLTPSGVDVTPFLFAITIPIIAWAVSRYRLLDIVPYARAQVLADLEDGIIVVDHGGRIVDVNETGRRFLDARTLEIQGSRASDVLEPFPQIASELDDHGDEPVEVAVTRDGEHHVYDVTVTEFAVESTNPGTVIVLRDITESRHAQRRFKTLIEQTADVVSIHDEGGRVEYVSPAIEHVLGYDPLDLVGRDALELVHPEDRESIRAAFLGIAEAGGSERVEYRIRHLDGSWRTVESIGEDFLEDRVIGGIVLTSRDVTERKRYEQRLQVLNRVLRHDLRNDVNVISGNVEMLRRTVSDPEALERLDTIQERATDLVEQGENARLIDHAFERDSPAVGSIDVVGILEDGLRTLAEKYPAVEIESSLPETCLVRADPLLGAAIDQVLDNGVRHNDRTEPTVSVEIDVEPPGAPGFVDVRIADDGPGVPERERRVLQAEIETPLEHMSGLGLWFVNWVLEESRGELRFEGNDGRGTTVTFRLSRAATSP